MKEYKVIGLMSGTSLDGLDIAACTFINNGVKWDFEINAARTIPYEEEWREKLSGLHARSAFDFALTDTEYGNYLGRMALAFIRETGFQPELIASHGHTIFHRPDLGFTTQAGAGSSIAAVTGIPVVNDFRSLDVALGGQGAPLVPIGDRLLFGNYDACLNLGGFANISMEYDQKRVAFDICPVNFVLNKLARRMSHDFDHDGNIARLGKVDESLLLKLGNLVYYNLPFPKSLGREWVENNVDPLLANCGLDIPDVLRTFCEHIAKQIHHSINQAPVRTILVTGGGARNKFLVELARSSGTADFIIPSDELIDFKEALVFALLGLLRYQGKINVLHSVTGSKTDHSGGSLYII